MNLAIIQARLNSSRLPRKVLIKIAVKPMLWHVVNRVQKAKMIDKVIVAIPKKEPELLEYCRENKWNVARGSNENVLKRYYYATLPFKPQLPNIVRITSDCPLIDPDIIDKVISQFMNGVDYVSNVGSGYPDGLDVEVFSYATLERVYKLAKTKYDKEHVTSYIYTHPDEFSISSLVHEPDMSHLHWSVDTIQDLRFVRSVYTKLGNDFCMEDILREIYQIS